MLTNIGGLELLPAYSDQPDAGNSERPSRHIDRHMFGQLNPASTAPVAYPPACTSTANCALLPSTPSVN